MPDQLSGPDDPRLVPWPLAPPARSVPRRPLTARVVVGQVLGILALFALLGAAAGWLWFVLWDSPPGVVADGRWFPDPYMPGQQAVFDAIALYVLVAIGAGVLGGVVCALLLDRAELVTLAAVVVGSGLAGWLMALVGAGLGPDDPEALARTAADGTVLSGALAVHGVTPYLALPFGALVAVLVMFLATVGRRR